MAKPVRGRYVAGQEKKPNLLFLIFKGVALGFAITFLALLLVALGNAATDSLVLDRHMSFVSVAIAVASVFIGGAYVGQKAPSRGWLLGGATGLAYVVISVLIGAKVSTESFILWIVAAKLLAGIVLGMIGGLTGTNL